METLATRETPGPAPAPSSPGTPRLLDRVRQAVRARHLSPRTERAYVGWIRRFILFHDKRHPADMGEPEITRFLSSLATDGRVSASTQNQALSALLFLYRQVLNRRLEWLQGMIHAKRPLRLPVVLTRAEVEAVLGHLRGSSWLMASLMYGAGLRVMECCRLRIKDVDFARGELIVRDGKGAKDRITLLPARLAQPLATHLDNVQRMHRQDLECGRGHAPLPGALLRKYPNAAKEWGWQWIFPATRTYHDRDTGRHHRHHLHESVVQRAVKEAVRAARIAKPASCHTPCATRSPPTSSKALPFCHVTLKGQKPLPAGYPAQPKTLGDHLRKRRMDLGLSQRKLAKQLGVNKTSIEHWERNEVEPTRWMVPRIREFLGLQPSQAPTSFGERLTACRRALGLSQETLGRMLGVHKTTVVRWETGRRHPLRSLQGRIDALISGLRAAPNPRNPGE